MLKDSVCPICEKKITPDGKVCFDCKKSSFLDGMLVACSYKNNIVSKAIHILKYNFVFSIAPFLGEILKKRIENSNISIPDLIIPIPIHKRRLRWRGFNQSELLAKYVSENILYGNKIEMNPNLIKRIVYTKPQMQIKDIFSRKNNIQNAFMIENIDKIKGKTIFLIDDVATTGATIFECARILKEAGALNVFAIVIARQEINNKF